MDLKGRMQGFGIVKKQHDHIEQFKMQFFGSLFAYDEALMKHSDPALAGALWRNFFMSSETTTPEEIECVIGYIRKQLQHLDSLPSDQFVGKGAATFLRVDSSSLDRDYSLRRLKYCLSWPDWAPK